MAFLMWASTHAYLNANEGGLSLSLPESGVFTDRNLTYNGEPSFGANHLNSSQQKNSSKLPLSRHLTSILPTYRKSDNDGSWITMEGSFRNLSLYSIFWDNRSEIQTGPVIRVLGISTSGGNKSRSEETPYNVTCYVSCEPQGPVHRVQFDASQSVLIYNPRLVVDVAYERHVFACQLWQAPCRLPYRAAVAIGGSPGNVGAPGRLDETNSLLVEYPPQLGEVPFRDVGVCVSPLYGDLNAYRLIEWLEMLRLLGVDRVVVYNHSVGETAARILRKYRLERFVELRQIGDDGVVPVLPKDSFRADVYTLGPVALTDCMYRHMFEFEWLAVLDLDELILPRQHGTYQDLLHHLERTSSARPVTGFKFIHVDFVLDPILRPQPDQDVPWQLTVARFRRRLSVQPSTYHVKSIIDPRYCTAMHYHVCRGYVPGASKSKPVSIEYAMDCHYRSNLCPSHAQTFEECQKTLDASVMIVDNISLPFRKPLEKLVAGRLQAFDLETIKGYST